MYIIKPFFCIFSGILQSVINHVYAPLPKKALRVQDKDFDMKFIQEQMPSLQEVERLFRQQPRAQVKIDAGNTPLSSSTAERKRPYLSAFPFPARNAAKRGLFPCRSSTVFPASNNIIAETLTVIYGAATP